MTLRTAAILLAAAGLALSAAAATYKWVDKDGKVHYSDQPVAGAERVDLKPITEIESQPLPPAETSEAPPEPLDAATRYTRLAIISPKAGETVRGAGVGLSIEVDLQPGLGGQDRLEFTLDGKPVGATVPVVERGQHTVTARVVSPDGAVKIEATPVTFQVFQNIAKQPTPPKKPKKP